MASCDDMSTDVEAVVDSADMLEAVISPFDDIPYDVKYAETVSDILPLFAIVVVFDSFVNKLLSDDITVVSDCALSNFKTVIETSVIIMYVQHLLPMVSFCTS